MSTTLLTLDEGLCKLLGDFLQVSTTTNITTDTSVISTSLRNYDRGQNNVYANWWIYFEEGNNIGEYRQVRAYTSSTGTLELYGANLSAETGAVQFRLTRSKFNDRLDAINTALDEIYPNLYDSIDDYSIISNNALPNSSFETNTSGTPTIYSTSDVTSTSETSTIRGVLGSKSVKLTASADNGYLYISSDSYPSLLDLMKYTINFRAWAYPEVEDDASLVIYTKQADGTEQTLTSTTSCPAGEWTLLKLENQKLNEDLVKIEFRFKVASNTKYVYFDEARVTGAYVYNYYIPSDYDIIRRVELQVTNRSDYPEDDVSEFITEPLYGWNIKYDGTYYYLYIPYNLYSDRRIRILGHKQFSDLSSGSDTISIDGDKINLVLNYSAMLYNESISNTVNGNDISKYEYRASKFKSKYYELLPKMRMVKHQRLFDLGVNDAS